MKRRAVRAVLFVLLGAIVNVAVAWACAIWSPSTVMFDAHDQEAEWPVPVPQGWPANPVSVSHTDVLGYSEILAYGDDRDMEWEIQAILQFGLPQRSMFTERHKFDA